MGILNYSGSVELIKINIWKQAIIAYFLIHRIYEQNKVLLLPY